MNFVGGLEARYKTILGGGGGRWRWRGIERRAEAAVSDFQGKVEEP
jgi:hypothetical protein